MSMDTVLITPDKLADYVDMFNARDEELYPQSITNAGGLCVSARQYSPF